MTLNSLVFQTIGAGRMGRALTSALRASGFEVLEPGLRGATGAHADIVILAVPDAAIADAARVIAPGRIVAHLSGATLLDSLRPHECFSMHPLMTISGAENEAEAAQSDGGAFDGVFAALAGSSARSLSIAEELASALGMQPFRVAERDRYAYHAAASIASNFLVALEWFAEDLALSTGVAREALVPLVSATIRNWAATGPERALTGPIARGDLGTVELQRAAIAERMPQRLELFDALVAVTGELAERQRATGANEAVSEART